MTKEVLDIENVLEDVKDHLFSQGYYQVAHYSYHFWDFFLVSLVFLILLAFDRFPSPARTLCAVCFFALFGIALLYHARYLVARRALKQKVEAVSACDLVFERKKLLQVDEEDLRVVKSVSRRRSRAIVHFLYFPGNKWRIPGQCYRWSNTFKMSQKGVENTSLVGDEFYVVYLKGYGEIAAAYNTKFFVYCND